MAVSKDKALFGRKEVESERRDFLLYATTALGVVGTAVAAWPFVDSMNPAADVVALATVEVDLKPIKEGQSITVMWRGKPIFIRHRTAAEIDAARADDGMEMRDVAVDAERVKKPQWLVMVGICTHLGCVPQGQHAGEDRGDYGGWFCSCHGSHYDTSGRVRKGPAPTNLDIPDYVFLDSTTIRIG